MPSKGHKMTPEHKAAIRASIQKRNEEARQAAAAAVSAEENVTPVGGVEAELITPTPEVKPTSLFDRLKGMINQDSGATPGKPKKKVADSDGLIMAFVPLVASFLATYAGSLWEEPYRQCAPSKEEVGAMITPLFRILARRIEVNVQMTPDTEDIKASVVALLSYSFRSAILAIEIKEERERKDAVDAAERHLENDRRAARNNPGDARTAAYQGEINGVERNGPTNSNSEERGAGTARTVDINQDAPETDASYTRRIIAEAFAQDKQYRSEHGLL